MKTGLTRWSLACSLSCVSLAVFALVGVNQFMADVFTPDPPPVPAECTAPAAAPRTPSGTWLQDYFGPKPPPAGDAANLGANGIDGLWWPRGMQLEYIGRQLYFDGSEVGADSGFTITVPDGELWRVNWLAVDWITNMGSGTRFFLLQVLDFNNTGFGYYVLGKATPGDNDGGSVSFTPGIQPNAPVTQLIQEPLPRPLFVYGTWRLEVQLYNGGADFLNSLRADIERWLIVPRTAAPTGGTGGGTPSNPFGGPYFAQQ